MKHLITSVFLTIRFIYLLITNHLANKVIVGANCCLLWGNEVKSTDIYISFSKQPLWDFTKDRDAREYPPKHQEFSDMDDYGVPDDEVFWYTPEAKDFIKVIWGKPFGWRVCEFTLSVSDELE